MNSKGSSIPQTNSIGDNTFIGQRASLIDYAPMRDNPVAQGICQNYIHGFLDAITLPQQTKGLLSQLCPLDERQMAHQAEQEELEWRAKWKLDADRGSPWAKLLLELPPRQKDTREIIRDSAHALFDASPHLAGDFRAAALVASALTCPNPEKQ